MRSILIISVLVLLTITCSFSQPGGVRLLDYSSKNLCDSVHVDLQKARPTLDKSTLSDESLSLTIRVEGNCQNDFYGALNIDQDTLNLFFIPKGVVLRKKGLIVQDRYKPVENDEIEITLCECYLEMTYKISGLNKIPFLLKINGSRIYSPKDIYPIIEPTYETFSGAKVNRTDSIGRRQGRWIETNKDNLIDRELYYKDNQLDSLIKFTYEDSKVKRTRSENFEEDTEIETEYYQSGKIKQECIVTKHIAKPYTIVDSTLKGKSFRPKIKTCFLYSEEGKFIDLQVSIDE